MKSVSRRWVIAGIALIAVAGVVAAFAVSARNDECQYTEADVDLSIYAKKGASTQEVSQLRALEDAVQRIDGVEAVFFRSPQDALAQFESAYGDLERRFHQDFTSDDFAASLRLVGRDGTDPRDLTKQVPNSPAIDEVIVHLTEFERHGAELFLPSAAKAERFCLSH